MRFLPSLTAVLLICITLNMAKRPDEEVDKCQNTVNYFRMEAGLEELKDDQQETARMEKMFKPGTRSCPTKSHLKNGFGGFTVTRMEERPGGIDILPNKNSILSHNVKTFACLDLDCEDHPGVVSFAFIKNGIAGYSIGKWFLMGAILAIYNFF
ncbi:hypothetical protein B9Z55_017211 [Caenorhabditis nigoni]|uniref:SCP domain-containing protein n=1 Tax=Caenorhabditis nigoni TaxID=1611254 RepID=A0A2G5T8F3_9PELO|nr:hypothetical protein B9Z55_017211 [Caenorhabditis nigoni]